MARRKKTPTKAECGRLGAIQWLIRT